MRPTTTGAGVFAMLACVASRAALDAPINEPPEVVRAYAEAGDPTAQYNLALLLQKGEGVKRDSAEALAWYRKAATAGFPEAQYNLGVLLTKGDAGAKDEKEAAKWFYAAASQGIFEAQKALIICYTRGLGVEKNATQALTWDFLARRTLELRFEQRAGEPPKPAKLRPDGFAEYTTASGQREAVGTDGTKEIIRADGSKTVLRRDGAKTEVSPAGERVTRYGDGSVVKEKDDGSKVTTDRNGTTETRFADGSRELEGEATLSNGKKVRALQKYDKDGKRISQRYTDGPETFEKLADGTQLIETVGEDEQGRKVRVIDSFTGDGVPGPRRLVREDGVEHTGADVWVIKRTLSGPGGRLIAKQESYGLGNSIHDEKEIPVSEAPKTVKVVPVPPRPSGDVFMPVQQATEQRPPVPQNVIMERRLVQQVDVYRPKVAIDEQLAELAKLEVEARYFAGASIADYEKARTMAQRFVIHLPDAPQKQPQGGNWLNQRIAAMAAPPAPPPLQELRTDRSESHPLGLYGRDIIKTFPWKHAETEHFVVHYAEASDAYPVMRYIECAYFVVTQTLQIDTSKSKRKSHVFIFPNSTAWQKFTQGQGLPAAVAGFAYKDELLLGAHDEKDTYLKILCHEATHAIVAHFYPGRKWPLWLNEGFAEYMAAKSIALRRSHQIQHYLSTDASPVTVDKVFNRIRYGVASSGMLAGATDVNQFYGQSERCVRVLLEKLPPGGFPRFANLVFAGNAVPASLHETYGYLCSEPTKFEAMVNAAKPK